MITHGLTSFLIATAAALSPNSAIVVGGSSGMGKAAAAQFVKAGGRALLVSRDADKLQRAREEILHATGADASAVDTAAVDATDEASNRPEPGPPTLAVATGMRRLQRGLGAKHIRSAPQLPAHRTAPTRTPEHHKNSYKQPPLRKACRGVLISNTSKRPWQQY